MLYRVKQKNNYKNIYCNNNLSHIFPQYLETKIYLIEKQANCLLFPKIYLCSLSNQINVLQGAQTVKLKLDS